METRFCRVRSVKDITISASLIIIGSILVALPTGTGVNITGFFLIFAGIILALVLKTAYREKSSGDRYEMKEFYFQQAMHAGIASAIATRPEDIKIEESDKGNAVKLDIFYSKKAGKAYLQLFEYVPYRYEPCSQIYEHDIDSVAQLIK